MKPITSELIYTGGNIYIGIGATDDGNWYIADHSNDSVRIVNANPSEAGEDMWDAEWQEEHLIMDFEDESKDTILFLYKSLVLCAKQTSIGSDVYKLMEYLEENYKSYFGRKVKVVYLAIEDSLDGMGELIEETEDSITVKWIYATPCYSCCHVGADAFRENSVIPKEDIYGSVKYDELYECFVEEMRQESIKEAEYKDEYFFGVDEKIPQLLKELHLKDSDDIPADYIKEDDRSYNDNIYIDIPFRGKIRQICIKHHYNKDCREISDSFGVQIAKNAYRDWLYENKEHWKNY